SRLLIVVAAMAAILFSTSFAQAQCQGGAGAQTGLASVSCTGVAAWSSGATYASGAQVVYNNCLYKTNQAFTSNSSWCPGCAGVYLYGNGLACPSAGCNYGAQGPCGAGATATATTGSTATSTATKTNSPTARATATAT